MKHNHWNFSFTPLPIDPLRLCSRVRKWWANVGEPPAEAQEEGLVKCLPIRPVEKTKCMFLGRAQPNPSIPACPRTWATPRAEHTLHKSLCKLAGRGRTAAGPPLLKLPLLPETQGLVHLCTPLFCPKINESQKPNITQMMLRVRWINSISFASISETRATSFCTGRSKRKSLLGLVILFLKQQKSHKEYQRGQKGGFLFSNTSRRKVKPSLPPLSSEAHSIIIWIDRNGPIPET